MADSVLVGRGKCAACCDDGYASGVFSRCVAAVWLVFRRVRMCIFDNYVPIERVFRIAS